MILKTNRNAEYEISVCNVDLRSSRIVFFVVGDYPLSKIAQDLDGVERFEVLDGDNYNVYDGYSCLTYLNKQAGYCIADVVKEVTTNG